MQKVNSEVYTATEAARIIGVRYKTILDYIHDGRIKVITGGDGKRGSRGSQYMIAKDEVEKFIAEHKRIKKRGRPKKCTNTLIDEKSVMKRLMQRNGYTVKKLVDKTDYCYMTILSVINGKTPVTPEFSRRFADIFGLDWHELDLCIKKGELPFLGEETKIAEEVVKKAVNDRPTLKAVLEEPSEKNSKNVNPKVYYAVTCYVRTREGLVFDNVGYNLRRTNLGTKKIFTTKSAAEGYLLDVIHAKRDEKNNSGCFYKVTVNEAELVAYKTICDICEVEVEE